MWAFAGKAASGAPGKVAHRMDVSTVPSTKARERQVRLRAGGKIEHSGTGWTKSDGMGKINNVEGNGMSTLEWKPENRME